MLTFCWLLIDFLLTCCWRVVDLLTCSWLIIDLLTWKGARHENMKSINKRLVGCRQLHITLHVSIVTRIEQSWPPPMFTCYTSKKTGKTVGHPQHHGFKSWSNDWDDVGLPPCLGKSPLEKLNPKVARMAHSQHFSTCQVPEPSTSQHQCRRYASSSSKHGQTYGHFVAIQ